MTHAPITPYLIGLIEACAVEQVNKDMAEFNVLKPSAHHHDALGEALEGKIESKYWAACWDQFKTEYIYFADQMLASK